MQSQSKTNQSRLYGHFTIPGRNKWKRYLGMVASFQVDQRGAQVCGSVRAVSTAIRTNRKSRGTKKDGRAHVTHVGSDSVEAYTKPFRPILESFNSSSNTIVNVVARFLHIVNFSAAQSLGFIQAWAWYTTERQMDADIFILGEEVESLSRGVWRSRPCRGQDSCTRM